MGNIINGRELAKKYREIIKNFTESLGKESKRVPCIATILVGNDGGSIYYVNSVSKVCREVGIEHRGIFLDESITEKELIYTIQDLNNDKLVDGVIIQMPLPKHIDEKKVINELSYKKDIDGLTEISIGKLYSGEECFIPCTPQSVLELLESLNIDLAGKEAVVVGRSNIVGKPVAQLLLNRNCTVTVCHSKTKDLKSVCKRADILVAAIGKPNFINKDFIKEGAIVIDVGTSSVDGKICGDVLFEDVISKADYITPVPGGVGAMTTTLLLRNTCKAFEKNAD